MTKDIFITLLIVSTIYTTTLLINKEHLPEKARWSDYLEYMSSAEPDWTGRIGAALGETQSDISRSVTNPTSPPPKLAAVDENREATFSALELVGVRGPINFSEPQLATRQVQELWKSFENSEQLHRTVSWETGSNICYAYYHDFSEDYTRAQLLIGYASSKTLKSMSKVKTASGPFSLHQLNANGELSDDAWSDAYPNGVVLKRFIISYDGNITDGDAVIIK